MSSWVEFFTDPGTSRVAGMRGLLGPNTCTGTPEVPWPNTLYSQFAEFGRDGSLLALHATNLVQFFDEFTANYR